MSRLDKTAFAVVALIFTGAFALVEYLIYSGVIAQ